ncbi:MAG: putative metallopeptidase [Pirellulales bacterium]
MTATKKVAYAIVERKGPNGRILDVYKLMEELVKLHHKHLDKATIAIAWCYTWKQDKDGRLKIGDAKKASEIDRQLHKVDLVILLNDTTWNHSTFTDAQRRALMDECLCRLDISRDEEGQPRLDENGRIVYVKRKPDMVGFSEVLARHGIWTKDLERVAAIIQDDVSRPLLGSPLRKEEPKAESDDEDDEEEDDEDSELEEEEEDEDEEDDELEDKAASGDGAHEPVLAGTKVRLLRNVAGYDNGNDGLTKGKIFEAEAGSNGIAQVRSNAGRLVLLPAGSFEYV